MKIRLHPLSKSCKFQNCVQHGEKSLPAGRELDYNYNYVMETFYTSKIVKTGTSLTIVIPVDILRGYGWARGDTVIFTSTNDDTLIIKKLDDESIRRLKNISGSVEGDERTIQYD